MMYFVCNNMEESLKAANRAVELSVKVHPGQMTLPVAITHVRQGIVKFGMLYGGVWCGYGVGMVWVCCEVML